MTGDSCGAARRRRVSGRADGGKQQRGADGLVVGVHGGGAAPSFQCCQVKIEVEVGEHGKAVGGACDKAVGGACGDGGGEAVGGAYVGGAAADASYSRLPCAA